MTYREYDYAHDDTAMAESGAGFLVGLLSGVAVGIGIGMLFAPRSGSELRHDLARSASDLQRAASESLNQASSKVRQAAESAKAQGSGTLSGARDQWNEMRDEAQAGTTPTPTTSSPYVS
jgi:gas vesicle protein